MKIIAFCFFCAIPVLSLFLLKKSLLKHFENTDQKSAVGGIITALLALLPLGLSIMFDIADFSDAFSPEYINNIKLVKSVEESSIMLAEEGLLEQSLQLKTLHGWLETKLNTDQNGGGIFLFGFLGLSFGIWIGCVLMNYWYHTADRSMITSMKGTMSKLGMANQNLSSQKETFVKLASINRLLVEAKKTLFEKYIPTIDYESDQGKCEVCLSLFDGDNALQALAKAIHSGFEKKRTSVDERTLRVGLFAPEADYLETVTSCDGHHYNVISSPNKSNRKYFKINDSPKSFATHMYHRTMNEDVFLLGNSDDIAKNDGLFQYFHRNQKTNIKSVLGIRLRDVTSDSIAVLILDSNTDNYFDHKDLMLAKLIVSELSAQLEHETFKKRHLNSISTGRAYA